MTDIDKTGDVPHSGHSIPMPDGVKPPAPEQPTTSDHVKTIARLQLQLTEGLGVHNQLCEELRRLDGIIKGTRLVLAGLVHQVGGEVVLDESTLRLMDSGDFVMDQKTQSDPISVRIVVTKKEPVAPDASAEENDSES